MSAAKLIITLSTVLLLFTGCGNSFSTEKGSVTKEIQDGSNKGQDAKTPDNAELPINNDLVFSAGIESKFFGSGRVLYYNSETKSLEISVPFPFAALIPDASGVLPKHPSISFRTDSSEKTLTLSLPISAYLDLVENPTKLPNGHDLPGVNGGEAPSFGFPLGFLGLDAYGYAAFDSFSLFIESSLKLPINLTIPLRSEQNNLNIGKIEWLRPVNGQSGGVFISFRLPKELSVILANAL